MKFMPIVFSNPFRMSFDMGGSHMLLAGDTGMLGPTGNTGHVFKTGYGKKQMGLLK
jgi:hypothetical protein